MLAPGPQYEVSGITDRDGGGLTARGSFSTLDGRRRDSAGGARAVMLSDRTLEKINNLTIYIEPGTLVGRD